MATQTSPSEDSDPSEIKSMPLYSPSEEAATLQCHICQVPAESKHQLALHMEMRHKSKALISEQTASGGAMTYESLKAGFEAVREVAEHHEPTYTPMPEWIVDEFLRQGIIPQFVIVSSNSNRKIRDYVKAHPEAVTHVKTAAKNSPDTNTKAEKNANNPS